MQQVRRGSTDTLLFYPPLFDERGRMLGRPSSALVRIATAGESMPAVGDEEAATVDAVSTTTSAAALQGATTLSFAADPGFVSGRKYLVDPVNGQRFHIVPRNTGTVVTLSEPLPSALASGSPIYGIAITHALTAAETGHRGEALVAAYATIDGVRRDWVVRFEVVRRIFALTLDAGTLTSRRPEVDRLRNPRDPDFSEAIWAAWSDLVRTELRAQGYHEERINSASAIEPAVIAAVVHLLTRNRHPDRLDLVEATDKDWRQVLRSVISGAKYWYDADDESALEIDRDATPVPSIRFTR